MSRDQDENHLYQVVSNGLRSWLAKARAVVMAPWTDHKMSPNPHNVYYVQQDWHTEVDTILTEIGKISLGAWSRVTDVPAVSRHSFVMAHLAQVENLLVRIPEEVASTIFEKIIDVVNGGGSTQDIAQAVDNVLTWTGSENWPNRARVIAITEVTRAYGAGTVAAGMEQSRVTGKLLQKRWLTEADKQVRASHRGASRQTVSLAGVFLVGDSLLLFPGDPSGPPEEVINCRCDVEIVDGG